MPKYNRKCLYCGSPYYACRACIDINSWKNVCCSVECYRKMCKQIERKEMKPVPENVGEIKNMYIILKELYNNKEIKKEVTGYDLTLGRIDCSDGKTYTDKDIDHFEISLEELREISKSGGK